jgi:hypothetical protein
VLPWRRPKPLTRRAVISGAGGLALAGTLLGRSRGGDALAAPGQEIVGSWQLTVTGPASMTLQTYIADGGLVTAQGDHPRRSAGHGAWVRTGERRFLATHVSMRFGDQLELIGTTQLRLDITVDESGNSFTSRNIRDEFDLEGNLVNTIDAAGQATRIVPLPLD